MRKKEQMLKRVDVPLYRYWQALYMAFYSRRLYVDVAKRWRGFNFVYLLFVITVVSLPFSIRIMLDLNHYFNEQIISPLEQLPPLHLENGQILLDKPMPYLIKNKTGAVVIMVDTREGVKGMDPAYPELMILVAKDKLYFDVPDIKLFFSSPDSPSKHPTVQGLDKHVSEVFNAKEWIHSSGIVKFKWFLICLMYPAIISFFFGLICSISLVLTMFAQAFSWLIFNTKLTFKEVLRMLVVASTPLMTIFMLLFSVNRLFPGMGLVWIVLITAYFSYAVLAVKRENKMLVHA